MEILFRGKRADNGEWVYGYYVKKRDPLLVGVEYHFIVTQDRDNCGCLLSCVSWYRIIPETVGQFTGINDNNGNKIFEGDIAKVQRFRDVNLGKFIFHQKTGGFEFWWNVTVGAYGEKATHAVNLSVCDNVEVIGNIHDNPDLLT